MERLHIAIRSRVLQTLMVKLALSFGMVFWMFVVATLSHAS